MEIAARWLAALHLAAAAYWTGTLIFMAVIATPLIRRIRPPSFQRQFARRLWHGTHKSLWIATIALAATGAFALYRTGRLDRDLLNLDFWRTFEGNRLGLKLLTLLGVVGLSLVHDLLIGPGGRFRDPDGDPLTWATAASATRWLMAIGGLAVLLIGGGYLPF